MMMKEMKECRTVEEITEQNLVVQQLDTAIEKNEGDVLIHKVLRLNLISHEQNKDNFGEVKKFVRLSLKNPSLLWLFRYKTVSTITAILAGSLSIYVILRLIEITIGLEKIIESVLLP